MKNCRKCNRKLKPKERVGDLCAFCANEIYQQQKPKWAKEFIAKENINQKEN